MCDAMCYSVCSDWSAVELSFRHDDVLSCDLNDLQINDTALCCEHCVQIDRLKVNNCTGCESLQLCVCSLSAGGDRERMTSNHETYLLMASTQNDMEDWVKTIRRVIWAPFGGGEWIMRVKFFSFILKSADLSIIIHFLQISFFFLFYKSSIPEQAEMMFFKVM